MNISVFIEIDAELQNISPQKIWLAYFSHFPL